VDELKRKKKLCELIMFGMVDHHDLYSDEFDNDRRYSDTLCRLCGTKWGSHHGRDTYGYIICPTLSEEEQARLFNDPETVQNNIIKEYEDEIKVQSNR